MALCSVTKLKMFGRVNGCCFFCWHRAETWNDYRKMMLCEGKACKNHVFRLDYIDFISCKQELFPQKLICMFTIFLCFQKNCSVSIQRFFINRFLHQSVLLWKEKRWCHVVRKLSKKEEKMFATNVVDSQKKETK